MIIRLKREAICQEPKCGAALPVDALARYYGQGRVFGVECHGPLAEVKMQKGLDKQAGKAYILGEREG